MSRGWNAYDQQFEDRIKQIRQGGAGPPDSGGGGGGGAGGWAGCTGPFIWIALFVVLAIIRAAAPSRTYTPSVPPVNIPKFDVERFRLDQAAEQQRQLDEILRKMREDRPAPFDDNGIDEILRKLREDRPGDEALRKLLEDVRRERPLFPPLPPAPDDPDPFPDPEPPRPPKE